MSKNPDQWSIEELTTDINSTLETDQDFFCILDGGTGKGKSTLALKLAIRGCAWFDIKNDIIFSREELTEKIYSARRGSWLVVDEAINILFNRDFMNKQQKFLLRLLDMCRDRNLCLLMCVPNFWSMDKHILEGRVKVRIHVARTGLAFVWKPTGNPFTPDKWNRRYNEKVCYNWDSYMNARKTKGFIGFIPFGDLAEKYKIPYQEIKKRKKEEVRRAEEEKEQRANEESKKVAELSKLEILNWMETKGLLRKGWRTQFAEREGITGAGVNQKLKSFKRKYIDEVNPNSTELNQLNNKLYINTPKYDDIVANPEVKEA